MSPFEKIQPGGNPRNPEPTLTISKKQIFFNDACTEPANLERMKAAEIFWDGENRVLKLKLTHERKPDLFAITCNGAGGYLISCVKFIRMFRPGSASGVIHVPVRWDEKEKGFIGAVPSEKP